MGKVLKALAVHTSQELCLETTTNPKPAHERKAEQDSSESTLLSKTILWKTTLAHHFYFEAKNPNLAMRHYVNGNGDSTAFERAVYVKDDMLLLLT
jgi:ribosomal protein S12